MVDEATPTETWQALKAEPDAVLVDVRTEAEWQHIGIPLLDDQGRQPALVCWQSPDGAVNPAFLAQLRSAGVTETQKLYFLCRSGMRSLSAAYAAEAAGYTRCINVSDGFEGSPDARGQRGRISGWQAEGLPWTRLVS